MPSILAYFKTTDEAKKAKDLLEKMGVEAAQIDRVSEVPNSPGDDYNNPLANQAISLSALTQTGGNDILGNEVGALLAADPASSGLGGELVSSRKVLLTVVTSEDKIEDALKIIRENGGRA